MEELTRVLSPDRLVDLSQPLGPATTLWPGSTPFGADVLGEHGRDHSYFRTLTLPEHSGTHLDAPAHFAGGGASTDELPLGTLVRPAACLDVRALCGDDAGFTLSRRQVEALEADDGAIAAGSAVLICTGWDRYVRDPARYAGTGDVPSFPGIGVDAAELFVERGVVGVGIDTLGVDPGHATDFGAHRVLQPAGIWHLEGLVRLPQLPARGAWLIAPPLPLVAGSGSPVRAFAVLP